MSKAEIVDDVHSRKENRFADTLRFLLVEHGLKQKDLAVYLGIKPQAVSLYCTGNTYPDIHTLIRIAEFFAVSIDYLITGQKEEHKEISTETGLTSNAIDMLKKAQQNDTERDVKIMPVINHLLSNSSFYHSLFMAESHLETANSLFTKLESNEADVADVIQKEFGLTELEMNRIDVRYITLSVIKRGLDLVKRDLAQIFNILLKQTDISLVRINNKLKIFEIRNGFKL